MKKLKILIGISNSGKSTWAHETWQYDSDHIIVNRDKIRELLFGFMEDNVVNYYTMFNRAKCEKMVTRYEDTLINEALCSGKVPIIDATHLRRDYLERYKYWNVPVELKFFDVTLKEAIVRNASRRRQVPNDVLIKQYNQYVDLRRDLDKSPIDFEPVSLVQNEDNEVCVIFDVDGTLAHMGDRNPYDWDKVWLDTVDIPTAFMLDSLNGDCKVIICTGRDGICLDETKEWLRLNGIGYDEIYIRDIGDHRADWIVKEEMWRKIAEDNCIVGLYDDRLQVVRRARALGLKVFNVEHNNF